MKKSINADDLVRGYLSGKTLDQLAEEFGLCRPTVRKLIVARGVVVKRGGKPVLCRRIPEEVIDGWVSDYLSGKSIHDIVLASGSDPHTISDKLRERNVQLRSRAEYTGIGKRRISKQMFSDEVVQSAVEAYLRGDSAATISEATGASVGTICKWLGERGLTRTASEASRLMYSKLSTEERKLFTAAANRSNVGRTHPIEVLLRVAATRQLRLSVASPTETALREALRGLGYTVVPQRALGTYNLDLALEECRVAVEVQAGSSYSFLYAKESLERLEYILSQGWSVLFVTVRKCGFVFPDVVQKVLTFCEMAGRDKPHRCKYGVIRSDGKRPARKCPNPDSFSRVPGF